MLDLLKKLCEIPAVSGNESSLRDFILSEISAFAECKCDALGNIIAFKKGEQPAKKKIMLDAHMDEVGFIVTGINEDGTLSFSTVGGIEAGVMIARRVISAQGIYGVMSTKPVHLLEKDERKKIPKKDSIVIDIGANDKEDALRYISPGDVFTFDSQPVIFGENKLKARAIDDRAGCAILIDMIKKAQPYDLYFSFSVQEEVGLRGAKTSAYTINPDAAIVLEATTAADIPSVKDTNQVCKLSCGPVVSFMDSATLYDHGLYEAAFSAASDLNIKCQPKTAVNGGNNAGSVHTAREGIRTLSLSLPCRYLHSAVCMIDSDDLFQTAALAAEMAKRMATGEI